MSPVSKYPSRKGDSVFATSFRYPSTLTGVCTCNDPSLPGPRIVPCSSTARIETPGAIYPAAPSWRGWAGAEEIVEVSVVPYERTRFDPMRDLTRSDKGLESGLPAERITPKLEPKSGLSSKNDRKSLRLPGDAIRP